MDRDIEILITIISLISAIVGLIAAIAGRKQVIEIKNIKESTSQFDVVTSHPPSNLKWYDKTIWLVVAFILFWPVGLYGLYKSRTVSKSWKIGVFITFVVLALVGAFIE